MIIKKLNNPYPFTSRLQEAYKTILFISVFIFIFVFLFRTQNFPPDSSLSWKLFFSFLYGLTTFIVAMVNTMIFSLFVSPRKEKEWKVRNELILYLIHFITISLAIHFLAHIINNNGTTVGDIFKSMLSTTAIGLIPVSIHVLNQQMKLFKKYYDLANDIGLDQEKLQGARNEEIITFNGQSIKVGDILYIESDRNYLNIIFPQGKSLNIRLTLHQMENQLARFHEFIRCHRAYIVNTHRILKVEGNAQGLRLFLDESQSYVPVSRSYIDQIDHVIRPYK